LIDHVWLKEKKIQRKKHNNKKDRRKIFSDSLGWRCLE